MFNLSLLATFSPAVQLMVVVLSVVAVFFVFLTTRDILLRSSSLAVQLLCIVLVSVVPVIGYFLYLLVRPARTIKERHTEELLQDILVRVAALDHPAMASSASAAPAAPVLLETLTTVSAEPPAKHAKSSSKAKHAHA